MTYLIMTHLIVTTYLVTPSHLWHISCLTLPCTYSVACSITTNLMLLQHLCPILCNANYMRFQRKIIFHVHAFPPLVLGSVNLLWICADKLKTRLPCVYVHVTCWWSITTRDLDTNLAVPQAFLRRVFAWIFTVNKSALEISFKHFDLSFSWHSCGEWYFFLTFTRQINFPSSLKATLPQEMYPLR